MPCAGKLGDDADHSKAQVPLLLCQKAASKLKRNPPDQFHPKLPLLPGLPLLKVAFSLTKYTLSKFIFLFVALRIQMSPDVRQRLDSQGLGMK